MGKIFSERRLKNMTKDEFIDSTINLQDLFNKKLNDTQLEFWYDELKIYDIMKYKRAISEFAKSSKTLPALSEVLTKIKSFQEAKVINPIENAPKIKCSTCHGSGLVKYHQKVGNISYEYLCKCYCENGKNIDLPIKKYEDVFYYRSSKEEIPSIDYDISQSNF